MFFIAEAGSNHDGSLSRAKELIDIAFQSGADAVKFQLIPPFKKEWIDHLIEWCGDRIEFMATPFDEEGIEALKGKVKHWKISSTELADDEFTTKVLKAAGNDTVFVSDGAIDATIFIEKNMIPLACVIKYPAEPEDYAFKHIEEERWGLSDHTQSSQLAIMATTLGARVIEKHFTDDQGREGPDHNYALSPEQLKDTIDIVRSTEKILDNDKLTITDYVGRKLKWN